MRRTLLLTKPAGKIIVPTVQSWSAAAVATAVSAVSPAKPTGLAAGDILLAFCWANNTSSTWTCTTGGMTAAAGSGAIGCQNFQRVCDGSETTFTFTRAVSSSGAAGVILVRVSGGVFSVSSVATGAAALTIDLATVSAQAHRSLLVQVGSFTTTTAGTWTPPASATELADTTASGTAVEFMVGAETVDFGPTGVRTWSKTLSQQSRGAMFALAPAA